VRILSFSLFGALWLVAAGCGDDSPSGDPVCGNGVVEAGETCDGSCVADCDDDNPCTLDTLSGSPEQCDVVCDHETVAGCDPFCGNGQIEPWETCDGSCMTQCDDGDACTMDVLTGSADTCDVACGTVDITWCVSSDGCCPSGCDALSDVDCAPTCGNGVAEEGEACDGGDTRAVLCPDLEPGTLGVPDACQSDCQFPSVLTACCADDAWTNEVIDSPDGHVGSDNSIAMDASDFPCWATFDNVNSVLRYVRYNGTGWDVQRVDQSADVGGSPSLVLDATGFPHIGYFDNANQILKYARYNGSAWVIRVVTGSDGAKNHSSLALDSAGRPHIAYNDQTSNFLKYARFDGSDWIHETVDASSYVRGTQHLTLDSADRPHISYISHIDYTNDALMYASSSGGAWMIQQVDPDGGMDSMSRVVIDSAGHPHIAYHDSNNDIPKYARWSGGVWLIAVVDNSGGWEPALALDASDRPYIAYHVTTQSSNSVQRLAYLSGAGWVRVNTCPPGLHGGISMALDSAGHPHIGSRGGMSQPSLKYSHMTCP